MVNINPIFIRVHPQKIFLASWSNFLRGIIVYCLESRKIFFFVKFVFWLWLIYITKMDFRYLLRFQTCIIAFYMNVYAKLFSNPQPHMTIFHIEEHQSHPLVSILRLQRIGDKNSIYIVRLFILHISIKGLRCDENFRNAFFFVLVEVFWLVLSNFEIWFFFFKPIIP